MVTLKTAICVLGGGPAGCVIARRLAQLGHSTLLVERSTAALRRRAESLAPSTLQILDTLELSGIVTAATFRHERRALVRWESTSVRVRESEYPSLLVERSDFDRGMRNAAVAAGVRLLTPARAGSPEHQPCGGWLIPVRTADGQKLIETEFLVDARGKRWNAFAHGDGPRTVSMSAEWILTDKGYAETRIEAGANEWFWGSPMRHGSYSGTVFVDAVRAAGLRTDNRIGFYRDLLSHSTLLRNLQLGRMSSPILVRDATSRIASELIAEDFIRIGEAALAIDPLSSQGIQAAVLSAIQGAAAVNTIRSGQSPKPALKFYRDRQQHAARHAARSAAQLYSQRLKAEPTSFWRDRAGMFSSPVRLPKNRPKASNLCPPYVQLSNEVEIADVPVLVGDIIKTVAAISYPGLDQPVAYVGGIALAPLLVGLVAGSATDRLLAQWATHMPPQTAAQILKWLHGFGILQAGAGQVSPEIERDSLSTGALD